MSDVFKGTSNVIGIGIDLVEVSRIASMLERHGEAFLERTYTDEEIAYCSKSASSAMHYAARFAVKEAVAKALGCGISGKVSLSGISVRNDSLGCPHVVLDSDAQEYLNSIGGKNILISITHIKEYAQAMAVVVR